MHCEGTVSPRQWFVCVTQCRRIGYIYRNIITKVLYIAFIIIIGQFVIDIYNHVILTIPVSSGYVPLMDHRIRMYE